MPEPAKADQDTFFLLGGPGSLAGRFEDQAGNPDWQGWISADYSTHPTSYWHASTTGAQNLASPASIIFDGAGSLANPQARFARSVAVGDLDGDGHDDVIVGAPTGGTGGEVLVYFGGPTPNAAFDLRITGTFGAGDFGRSVASGGDINADGWDDLVVGAPGSLVMGGSGRVYVYFGGPGLDATMDRTYTAAADSLGISVAIIGDIDDDGYDDIAAGAIDEVRVYRGRPVIGAPSEFTLTNPAGDQGAAMLVARIGDFDHNLLDDLLVGVPANYGGNGAAYVWLSSALYVPGLDLVLATELPGLRLGTSIAGLGDINGDGFADVAVGTDGSAGGVGYVWI